jgi:hypothetical protein
MIDIQTLLESEGIYRTVIENHVLNWRLLSLKEYELFRKLRNNGILSDDVVNNLVFERCYLGNALSLPDDMYAGIPISLGRLIMHLSGDCEMSSLRQEIEVARQNYPSDAISLYMQRIILLALPQYKIEDILGWTRPKLFERFVISEHIMKHKTGDAYEFLDLKKIRMPGDRQKSGNANHGIDFAKENAQLDSKLGWREKQAQQDAQRPPAPPAPPSGQKKLTPKQARQLERMRKG